ncbi:MAG TPA: hypothetical protein PLO25_01640 [Candidatus Saccharibacteria bacterium]|nr:hypothetical protein [Candidatus Saccharibacteria bacterium]
MKNTIEKKTFRNVTLAVVYIFLISQIMTNGDKWFGNDNQFLAPFVILMLFSLSAAIVGGLVFGESVFLFFDNKKNESIKSAICSIGWLAIYTTLGLFILVLCNMV